MKHFQAPKASLGDLDAETAADVIAAAADVALILDDKGVICDLAFDREELPTYGLETWLGRPWLETVTVESRPKVDEVLQEAAAGAVPRWRHLNHPAPGKADLPILYSALRVGPKRRVVALGRDLRTVASLQQQLVEAQQSMERDYLRMRNVETRYRLIVQNTAEAILIVDVRGRKVIEANPAAVALFGVSLKRLLGRTFTEGFDDHSRPGLEALLNEAEATGRGHGGRAQLSHGGREVQVSTSLFRQDGSSLFLVRLIPTTPSAAVPSDATPTAQLLKVVERAPEAFVVTDPDGRIVWVNGAFVELVQLTSLEQAGGQPLERWLGQPGMDLGVLLRNLRQHDSVRLLSTVVRSDYGTITKVELSAVAVANGGMQCVGFLIRDIGRRLSAEARPPRQLPRSVEQLTELVGQVPLKELVRETTDIIERLCIEAALELTGDNRASAAEMLGLSRQSLYVKLRRYGLGDLTVDDEP